MKFCLSWGPLADLWDGRAAVVQKRLDFAEVLTGVLPAVTAAAVALVDPVTKLLSDRPGAVRLLRIAIPFAFLVVAIIAISARTSPASSGVGFGTAAKLPRRAYRYSRTARWTAKLLTFPVLVWLIYQLRDNAPNAIWARETMSGYVCAGTGEALRGVPILARDDLGVIVSRATATDDNGYFVLELLPWARRPVLFEATMASCGPRTLQFGAGRESDLGCPRDEFGAVQIRRRYQWTVVCP